MSLDGTIFWGSLVVGLIPLNRLIKNNEGLPLLVFLISYFFLFLLGALGMHFDAESYFSDWIASIGVKEVYLNQDQKVMHALSIASPLIMVPLGCIFSKHVIEKFNSLSKWVAKTTKRALFFTVAPLGATYFMGSFWFTLSMLWIFTFLSIHSNPKRLFPKPIQRIGLGHLFALTWCLCAFVLLTNGAFGSFYTFFAQYQDQNNILFQRANLTINLPIWYWPLAYTLLPMTCAAFIFKNPRPPPGKLLLGIFATCWILFAHFFKGQIFFFLLFLSFCIGSSNPKKLLKGVSFVAFSAFISLSIFYLTASGLSGDPKETWLLFSHFFYRLGTNQFYYISFFPDVYPFSGLDTNHIPLMDAQAVYGFMYPQEVLNPAGSTAGPYISNAWAQFGIFTVFIYGLLAGILLQGYWRWADAIPGTPKLIFKGRILFFAFMLSQLSIRDSLFSGWGLVWGCLGLLLLKQFDQQPAHPRECSASSVAT